jgi:hypothetical protein
MMRDDKLVRVAIRSGQAIERVVWVWGAILESAAEIDDDGRFDVDAAEVAYFLRADEADIHAVLSALADAGRVADGAVVKWRNRQFQSDRSKERVAAHRERKRSERDRSEGVSEAGNGAVTLQDRDGNAPETETELKTEVEKTEAKASSKNMGSRLPDGWEAKPLTGKTLEMVAAWPAGMIERELAKFKDHWLKTPGSRGRSLDWDASYRNWLRNAEERRPRQYERPNPNPLADAVNRILSHG